MCAKFFCIVVDLTVDEEDTTGASLALAEDTTGEDEAAVKKYCEAVSFFFDRGTPIFHMEVIGKDARIYCEDLDVLCPSGKPPKEHVLDDEFLSIWMAIMAEIYPEVHPLQPILCFLCLMFAVLWIRLVSTS